MRLGNDGTHFGFVRDEYGIMARSCVVFAISIGRVQAKGGIIIGTHENVGV